MRMIVKDQPVLEAGPGINNINTNSKEDMLVNIVFEVIHGSMTRTTPRKIFNKPSMGCAGSG